MGWRGRRPDRPGVIRRTGRWSAGLRAGPGPARGRPDPARPTRRGRRRPGLGRGRALGGAGLAGRLAGGGCRVAGDRVQDRRHVGGAVRGSGLRLSGGRIGVRRRGWPPGAGWPAAGCPAVAPGWRPADASGSTVARALERAGLRRGTAPAARIARAVRPSVVGAEAVVSLLVTRPRAARPARRRSWRRRWRRVHRARRRSGRPGGDRAASHRPGRVSPGCRAG